MGISSRLRGVLGSGPALVVLLVAAIVGTATIGAAGAASTGLISACVNTSSGTIRIIAPGVKTPPGDASGTCAKNETLLSWNAQGIQGPPGPTGPQGPQGPAGPAGTAAGSACTTVTGQPGTVRVTVGSTNVLTLTCMQNGVAPNWSISPASHDYGSVPLTTSSAPFAFIVTNTGNGSGTIPGLTPSASIGPSLTLDQNLTTCSPVAILAPGTSCLLLFAFTPQALGLVTGTLQITGFPSSSVTISGTGVSAPPVPVFTLAPQAHDYGTVAVGATSAPFTFTLSNTGTGDSGPYQIQLGGIDALQFLISSTTCDGLNLAANASCQIAVVFDPTSPGSKTGAVIVSGVVTASAAITGNLININPAALSITPASHDYGLVAVGASAPFTFTLTNVGGTTSGNLSGTLSGTNAAQFTLVSTTCPFGGALAPAASCTVTVSFAPTVSGAASAVATASASPGGTASATLTGTAP